MKKGMDLVSALILCSAMLIWASSFIALKLSIGPIGPMSVIFGRMLVGSLCFLYFVRGFFKLKFTKQDIKYILLMSLCEPCLYFLFEAKAIEYGLVSQIAIMVSMGPFMVAIFAVIFLKEIISKKLLLGATISVGGVIWLSLQANVTQNASNPLLGIFLEAIAVIFAAGYSTSVRFLSAKFSAIFLTAIQTFIGTIFFLPLAIWEYNSIPMNITKESIFSVIYLGVVVTIGGYGLYNYALSRVQASKAAIFLNLIPVFSLILAYFLLNERLSFIEIIASIIILFGVFVSEVPTKILKKIKAKIFDEKLGH